MPFLYRFKLLCRKKNKYLMLDVNNHDCLHVERKKQQLRTYVSFIQFFNTFKKKLLFQIPSKQKNQQVKQFLYLHSN